MIRRHRLMTAYGVDTVYLSHIHSYLEYTRDGVRYLITGGAGAELLTTTSYYHYLISSLGEIIPDTIVELPSPASNYLSRYGATMSIVTLTDVSMMRRTAAMNIRFIFF